MGIFDFFKKAAEESAKEEPAKEKTEKENSDKEVKKKKKVFYYKNSKGKTYYLHTDSYPLKGGRSQTIHYFAENIRPAASEMPLGLTAVQNFHDPLPYLISIEKYEEYKETFYFQDSGHILVKIDVEYEKIKQKEQSKMKETKVKEIRFYIVVRRTGLHGLSSEDDGNTYYEIWLAVTDNPDDIYDRDLEVDICSIYNGKIDNEPDCEEWDEYKHEMGTDEEEEVFKDDNCSDEWDCCFKSEEEAENRANEVAEELAKEDADRNT